MSRNEHVPRGVIRLVELPTIATQTADAEGNITVCTAGLDCQFDIARLYWIHSVRCDEVRGQHAHRTLSQLMVAVSGAFEITLDGGGAPITYVLDTPCRGLLVGPGYWRIIRACKAGAVLLVAASAPYDEADYIRSYDEFRIFSKMLEDKVDVRTCTEIET